MPGAAGGRPQCAAEPGHGGSGRAGLHPLLQSHRVLETTGIDRPALCASAQGLSGTNGPALCASAWGLLGPRQVQTSFACGDLFGLIAWGLGFTVAGPETVWSTHPARLYFLLLKNKAWKIQGMTSTVFNRLVICGTVAIPALPHCLCVLGQVIIALSVFRRSVGIMGINCFKNCKMQYKYRMCPLLSNYEAKKEIFP